jgi:hypothetical protein
MAQQWTKVSIGIVCFIVGALFGGIVVLHPWVALPDPKTNVLFPDIYGDHGSTDDYANVQGRWSQEAGGKGGELFSKNNYATITCKKDRNECLYSVIGQIGPNQLSDINPPTPMPITHWDTFSISASDSDQDAVGCFRTTINIDRKNDAAELVLEPINQSKLACLHSDNAVYKYALKHPLSWYVMHPNEKSD